MEQMNDARGIIGVKQRLLASSTDAVERFKLLVDIGESFEAVEDDAAAQEAYRGAIEIDPNSKVVLNKLLNLFTASGNWRRATEVLGKLATLEPDDARRAKILFTIAAVFRDQLSDIPMAVEFFNKALDVKPDYLEAFEAVDRALTTARDWKSLERNYRRMLERVTTTASLAENAKLKELLLRNLGEVYRSRLQQFEDAIAAFKLASQVNPADEQLQEILAELYEKAGKSGTEVIEAHRRLIDLSPFRMDSYKALFKAYLDGREYDKAWCMAAALTVLQKASPDEEEYYRKYLPPTPPEPRQALSTEQWRVLLHPELDIAISNIFGLIAVNLRDSFGRDPKAWGINKKRDRIDLAEATLFSRAVKSALAAQAMTEPVLYLKEDASGLQNANAEQVSLIVGRDMLGGKQPRDLAFAVNKALCLVRPEFYLASAFPASEPLKVFLYAALAVSTGQIIGDAPVETVQQYAHAMQGLPEPVVAQLNRSVQALRDAGRNPDVSRWLQHADHSANRVGLLLCGDLRQAIVAVKEEKLEIGRASKKDKVTELIQFSISEPYFRLRRDLGIALANRS
jgi:tetratricopeptide (TPR) repeat protein